MPKLLLVVTALSGLSVLASPAVEQHHLRSSAASSPSGRPTSYALNAVSPGASGPWSFFVSAAGETNAQKYLQAMPDIDAANVVRVVAEVSEPHRPMMEWEYGYAQGLVTIRPESDRNVPSKKGDLIAMWAAPLKGRYQIQIEIDNVGNDARGGDGGTIILSRLQAGAGDDTHIIERIAIPASGFQSPHMQRSVVVEVGKGERIVMRLNTGIDGFADLWRLRYAISRAGDKTSKPPPASH